MCPHCNANVEMVMPISTVRWIVVISVLATFIISWFLFHLWFRKKSYPKFFQRLEQCIEALENLFLSHWFTILFVISSIYVYLHFEECLNLTFTAEFNGYNVIFIFWLVLLIIPLFDKFEISGISIKTRKQLREFNEKYETEMKAAMKAANNEQTLDSEGLEKLNKNGNQDE